MGQGALRVLKVAVAVMTVLIVAGVATLAVLIARRMSGVPGAVASVVLDEPAGTHLVGAGLAGERMTVRLQGGGPDRVVVLDTRTGRVVARVALAR